MATFNRYGPFRAPDSLVAIGVIELIYPQFLFVELETSPTDNYIYVYKREGLLSHYLTLDRQLLGSFYGYGIPKTEWSRLKIIDIEQIDPYNDQVYTFSYLFFNRNTGQWEERTHNIDIQNGGVTVPASASSFPAFPSPPQFWYVTPIFYSRFGNNFAVVASPISYSYDSGFYWKYRNLYFNSLWQYYPTTKAYIPIPLYDPNDQKFKIHSVFPQNPANPNSDIVIHEIIDMSTLSQPQEVGNLGFMFYGSIVPFLNNITYIGSRFNFDQNGNITSMDLIFQEHIPNMYTPPTDNWQVLDTFTPSSSPSWGANYREKITNVGILTYMFTNDRMLLFYDIQSGDVSEPPPQGSGLKKIRYFKTPLLEDKDD